MLMAPGEQVNAGPGVRRGRRHLRRFQVPAGGLDLHRGARPGSDRENARHERQLADADPVHEVLASTVDAVVDAEHILAVPGNLAKDRGVGLEAVVVVIRHLLAVCVMQHQHGLEPAGHGVGDIGDQLPRPGSDDQPLALARYEAIPVNFPGSDLAIQRTRQGDPVLDLVRRALAEGEFLFAQHLVAAGDHWLAAQLGQLADAEDHRVGQAGRGPDPEFPLARLGVVRDGDFDEHQPASAALAGRLQYSAMRFSIFAMSLRVASFCTAGAFVFPGDAPEDIKSSPPPSSAVPNSSWPRRSPALSA